MPTDKPDKYLQKLKIELASLYSAARISPLLSSNPQPPPQIPTSISQTVLENPISGIEAAVLKALAESQQPGKLNLDFITSIFNDMFNPTMNYLNPIIQISSPNAFSQPPPSYAPLYAPPDLKDKLGTPEEVEQKLQYVAFEAGLLYGALMRLHQRSQQLGRQMVVVANQSNGELVVTGIKRKLAQNGIEIYSPKVASSTASDTKLPDSGALATLSETFLTALVKNQPIIAVVDGTDDAKAEGHEGTYVRYPRSMWPYLNMIAAANEALGVFSGFGFMGPEHVARLRGQGEFRSLVDSLRGCVDSRSVTYGIGFLNPANSPGVVGVNSHSAGLVDRVVQPINIGQIDGPAMIVITSTADTEALRAAGINPPEGYKPGILDDAPWNTIANLQPRLEAMVAKHIS